MKKNILEIIRELKTDPDRATWNFYDGVLKNINIDEIDSLIIPEVIREIRCLLSSKDISLKEWAIELSGRIGSKAVELIPILKHNVDDPACSIRTLSLEALYLMIEDKKEITPILISALGDKYKDVRYSAIRILYEHNLATGRELTHVIGALADNYFKVRNTAKQIILNIADSDRLAVPLSLQNALRDGSIDICEIGEGFEDNGREALLLLRHESPEIRAKGAEDLSKVRGRGRIVFKNLSNALNDTDEIVRVAAANTLASMWPEDYVKNKISNMILIQDAETFDNIILVEKHLPETQSISELLIALNDEDIDIRCAAIWGVYHLGESAAFAVPELIKCMDSVCVIERDSAEYAIERLKCLDKEEIEIDNWLAELKSEDRKTRYVAALNLIRYPSTARSATPVIKEILSSSDQKLQLNAIHAISKAGIAGVEVLNELLAIKSSMLSSGKSQTKSVLNKIKEKLVDSVLRKLEEAPISEDMVPFYIEKLNSDDHECRVNAMAALYWVGHDIEDIAIICDKMLRDRNWQVREWAALTLRRDKRDDKSL